MLSEAQTVRYSRQIILPAVGGKGQQRLLSGAAAIVGTGEMAATVALYLSAAGVGTLTLAGTDGTPAALEALNPDCGVTSTSFPLSMSDAVALVRRHSVVVAANCAAEMNRRLNVACLAAGRPLVWGGAYGHAGRCAVLVAPRVDAPCYDCLPAGLELDAASANPWLADSVAALIGTTQATEVIKLMLALDTAGTGRLFTYDALLSVVGQTALTRNPGCAACGTGASRNAGEG